MAEHLDVCKSRERVPLMEPWQGFIEYMIELKSRRKGHGIVIGTMGQMERWQRNYNDMFKGVVEKKLKEGGNDGV